MNALPATLAWCVLQVTLLAAFVAAWRLVLRRSAPATRSLAVFTGLSLIVALTLASFAPWPRWSAARFASLRRTSTASRSGPSSQSTASATTNADIEPILATDAAAPVSIDAHRPSPAALFWESFVAEWQAPAPSAAEPRWTWPMVLAVTMLIGSTLGVVRLLAGLVLVRSYRTRSRAIADSRLLELRDVIQAELQCPQAIALHEMERLATAATIGWRKPLILLPANWREWNDDERRAVLAHEIAHIQRRDFLTWVAAQGALVLHFYHPLVHWLCGRLRLEQELAADAAAARLAGGQQTYLATLAAMALRQADRPVAWPARTFLPTRGTFLRRIEMLRDVKLGSTTSIGVRLGTVGVLLAAGLAISGLRGAPAGVEKAAAAPPAEAATAAGASGGSTDAASLAYIPRDALTVARIRPGELLKRAEFASILAALKEREFIKPVFGIGIDRVVEATWIALPSDPAAGPPLGCLVTAATADDATALARFLVPKPIEQEFGDCKYFKGTGTDACHLFVNDRTVLLAPESILKRMIVASATGGVAKAKWGTTWAEMADRPAALLVNAEALRPILNPTRNRGPQGSIPLLASIAPLWQNADVLTVAAGIDRQITLYGALQSASKENADVVHETLRAVITLAKNALSEIRASAALISDRKGLPLLVAADVADSALNGVTIEQHEQIVQFVAAVPEKEAALLASLLLPALTDARGSARQLHAKNNLKQIGLALQNYHDKFGQFPPAVLYGQGGNGKSKFPHSWRVALLPYLDGAALYNQYRFDEPWDSENNRKVLAEMPAGYRDPNAPADSTNSSYFALVGEADQIHAPGGEAFGAGDEDGTPVKGTAPPTRRTSIATPFASAKGTPISEVTDGTSNTLLVVEAQRDIPWTKPQDIPYAADKPLPKFGGNYPGGFLTLLADGRVVFLSEKIDEKTLRNLITMNDGNPVDFDKFIVRDGRDFRAPVTAPAPKR